MKVFVAGARGIESSGATAVICDAFDTQAVTEAVAEAAPVVVINQLTNLPSEGDQRDPDFFTATNRLRREGSQILIKAAQAAAVKRLVTQSIAFTYLPRGSWVKVETDATVGAFDDSINMRGASNAKAKAELGWKPPHPSWRTGFAEDLSQNS